ncbi:hypothetical protein FVE85_0513 [Porphyridium purpureum]|uniref:Uncharacterized protein n=1 Tax=Porphyridium purpureum TaxID=35688 RepID=A0A5J4Z1H3_PORPP|nr:hypothetical protein FVE85_0513 [Porphyridium purpureum]|eukprot:POR3922..scf208_2
MVAFVNSVGLCARRAHPSGLDTVRMHAQSRPHENDARSGLTRRAFVALVGSSWIAGSALQPARADRTGKFSTKLTAKRRYLPRIEKGSAALSELLVALSNESSSSQDWHDEVNAFVKTTGEDMASAMSLFCTTYYSEGNKLSKLEKDLTEAAKSMQAHFRNMDGAKSRASALEELRAAAQDLNSYISMGKLDIPLIVV